MRVLVACKRGNVAPRDKWGHCLCADCKAATKAGKSDRREYHRQWRSENPDKVRSYSQRWREKNPEKRKEIIESWRARNPDKVKAMSAKAGKKWAKENKSKRLASVRARQMAQKLRMPSWADRRAIAAVYEKAAALTRETGIPHEVDHVFPLQGKTVSGLHVANNLQILERSANRSKGIKLCAA